MTTWTKKITKQELKHLAESSSTGKPTLRSLRENLRLQHHAGIHCYKCEDIARKLGVALPKTTHAA